MPLSRRRFLVSSSVACATAALGSRWTAALAQSGGAFETVRGNVSRFTGRGGTIGCLVSEDALIVVDSQFPESARACLDGLRQRSGRPIDALINTHHHGDHTSGNGVFRPDSKVIVAHAKVPGLQQASAAGREDAPPPTVADTTFDKEWSIDLGKETVTARHYMPAHTAGDCVVHFHNANVVHMGDLVFNRWHPFIDTKGGASVRGWAEALFHVIEVFPKDTRFIFGHGQNVTGSREDVAEQRRYLLAVLDIVRKGVRGGKSLTEVKLQDALPGFDDYTSRGDRLSLAANLQAAYEELSAGER